VIFQAGVLLLSTRVLHVASTSDISSSSSTYTSKSNSATGKRGHVMGQQVKWPHNESKSYKETVKHADIYIWKAKKTSKCQRKAKQ